MAPLWDSSTLLRCSQPALENQIDTKNVVTSLFNTKRNLSSVISFMWRLDRYLLPHENLQLTLPYILTSSKLSINSCLHVYGFAFSHYAPFFLHTVFFMRSRLAIRVMTLLWDECAVRQSKLYSNRNYNCGPQSSIGGKR